MCIKHNSFDRFLKKMKYRSHILFESSFKFAQISLLFIIGVLFVISIIILAIIDSARDFIRSVNSIGLKDTLRW